ncbi:hypothetical protein COU37_04460 [Candidatus Micrarchaeota archaeon CG10_big_fil_rev_8_21_14_0_10_45_29]|nr:MAG: hypothetical protein COU37_04460 [Candidatus Micrarchaeota archaeon CG10_big_fil_rev_8_21_14_0_10_45_29]
MKSVFCMGLEKLFLKGVGTAAQAGGAVAGYLAFTGNDVMMGPSIMGIGAGTALNLAAEYFE